MPATPTWNLQKDRLLADSKNEAGSSTAPAEGGQPAETTTTSPEPNEGNPGTAGSAHGTPAVTVRSGPGNGPAWGAAALSVIALAAAGYAWYQTAVNARLADSEQDSRIGVIEERLGEVADTQADVDGLVEQIRRQLADNQADVAEQVSQAMQLAGTSESALLGQISEIKQQQATSEGRLTEQIRTLRTEAESGRREMEATLMDSRDRLAARNDEFRREFNALVSSIGELQAEIGTSAERWGLRQAEHLLVVANQRVLLGEDVQGARAALEIADRQLSRSTDPSLLPVREALSAEIAALEGVRPPDYAGVTHTLSVLSRTLEDLPMRGITSQAGPAARVQPAAAGGDGLEDPEAGTGERILNIGRTFLADLGDLVQVEKDGEPLVPPLSPEIRQMIVERGKLILEGAQVAMLRQESGIFLDRLEAAEQWIRERYDDSHDRTVQWLEQLSRLKSADPKPDIPDISTSLGILRDLMNPGA